MAKGEGLTNRQKEFLAVVLKTPYILKRFYLGGGTALGGWYLHHRESFDLDFFSQAEVNTNYIVRWLTSQKKILGIINISHEEQFKKEGMDQYSSKMAKALEGEIFN